MVKLWGEMEGLEPLPDIYVQGKCADGLTSRSPTSDLSSTIPSRSRFEKPRPIRRRGTIRCGVKVSLDMVTPLWRNGSRPSRGSSNWGHLRRMCFEIRSSPHVQLSKGLPGYGFDGVDPDKSLDRALAEVGLYFLRSVGKVVEGAIEESWDWRVLCDPVRRLLYFGLFV